MCFSDNHKDYLIQPRKQVHTYDCKYEGQEYVLESLGEDKVKQVAKLEIKTEKFHQVVYITFVF